MKLKVFAFLWIILNLPAFSYAQTSEGRMMLGGQVNVQMHQSSAERILQLDVAPNLMVFVQDNLAVGGTVELGVMRYEGNRYNSAGIFPSVRYYFGKPQQARLYLLGDLGYHLTSYSIEREGTARSGLGGGGGPGFAYFFNDFVSLECLAKARAIRYTNGVNSLNFQFKTGIQVYLKPYRF